MDFAFKQKRQLMQAFYKDPPQKRLFDVEKIAIIRAVYYMVGKVRRANQ